MFLWLGFQDLPDGYVCACPRGFSGPQCGTGGPLTCADEPCFNRGVCVTAAAGGGGSGSYTCRCPPGYAGSNCEMKANRCSGHPCANGNEPDRAQARLTLALRVVVVAGREKKRTCRRADESCRRPSQHECARVRSSGPDCIFAGLCFAPESGPCRAIRQFYLS